MFDSGCLRQDTKTQGNKVNRFRAVYWTQPCGYFLFLALSGSLVLLSCLHRDWVSFSTIVVFRLPLSPGPMCIPGSFEFAYVSIAILYLYFMLQPFKAHGLRSAAINIMVNGWRDVKVLWLLSCDSLHLAHIQTGMLRSFRGIIMVCMCIKYVKWRETGKTHVSDCFFPFRLLTTNGKHQTASSLFHKPPSFRSVHDLVKRFTYLT